jgi:hypothetical protein
VSCRLGVRRFVAAFPWARGLPPQRGEDHIAQGRRAAATLGRGATKAPINPEGVGSSRRSIANVSFVEPGAVSLRLPMKPFQGFGQSAVSASQGSRCAATLGYMMSAPSGRRVWRHGVARAPSVPYAPPRRGVSSPAINPRRSAAGRPCGIRSTRETWRRHRPFSPTSIPPRPSRCEPRRAKAPAKNPGRPAALSF